MMMMIVSGFSTETFSLIVAKILIATCVVFSIAFQVFIEGFTKAETTTGNGIASLRIEFLENKHIHIQEKHSLRLSYCVAV